MSIGIRPHSPVLLRDTVKCLRHLADTKNLELGKVVHAHLIVSNQSSEDNISKTNSLINLYSKCAELDSALQMFDKMSKRNVVSWSALMAGLFQNGFAFEVLRLFKSMVSKNDDTCPPNEYIFATVLSSCSIVGDIILGRQCHGQVLKSGLVFHQYVKNALVRLYSTLSDAACAMKVLVSTPGSDTCTYNLILNGLVASGYLNEASNLLHSMLNEHLAWNKATYISIFGLCARLKDSNLGHQVYNQLLKSDIEFDVFLGTAIIDMYGKCNEVRTARKVFDRLQARNVVSWTAMLAAYSHHGSFEESLKLSLDMLRENENVTPNDSTLSVLLNACAGLSSLGYGHSLHAYSLKTGFTSHMNIGNALINMYSKSGNIEAAKNIFVGMSFRDIITWNTMICGYSHHGLGEKSLDLFQEMMKIGVNPNTITFLGVLTSCAHLGRVEEGFFYLYRLMKQKGVEPCLEHYTCMVGLLSKAGLLNEAVVFMLSAPVRWDVVAWRTLLSACRVHRDYALGTQVAEVILGLDRYDVGTYTLLSNMHAKASKWCGVEKVRNLMKTRKLKKEPGLSWLEIKNQTHVFVSDDNQHPEFVQIVKMLKELFGKIRAIGYVVDTGNVLHDVDDEQKEDYIGYHSEKLAVAYGLMKTDKNAPIFIFKNLRMCDDCHLVMKLISKVMKRRISVRDVNRFHHFLDGSCSCADYW